MSSKVKSNHARPSEETMSAFAHAVASRSQQVVNGSRKKLLAGHYRVAYAKAHRKMRRDGQRPNGYTPPHGKKHQAAQAKKNQEKSVETNE